MSTQTFFINHGKRWAEQDSDKLKLAFQAGTDIRDMCELFRRTANGIAGRLKTLSLIPSEVNFENYEDHIVGWKEYMTCPEWRHREADNRQAQEDKKNKKDEANDSDLPLLKATMAQVLAELQALRQEVKKLRQDLYE